jgi:hypothetical protein
MAVASPIEAGTAMPPSRIVSARGTLTEYTPPFTLPARPSVRAMAAVSMPSVRPRRRPVVPRSAPSPLVAARRRRGRRLRRRAGAPERGADGPRDLHRVARRVDVHVHHARRLVEHVVVHGRLLDAARLQRAHHRRDLRLLEHHVAHGHDARPPRAVAVRRHGEPRAEREAPA